MITVKNLAKTSTLTQGDQSNISGGVMPGMFRFPRPTYGRPWCSTGLPTIFGRRRSILEFRYR